jgi:penicillin-insensitive murein DD-endopeptidase
MSGSVPIQPQDSRSYFMLPQAPEDAGYYVYGNIGNRPNTGHLAQYAHPNLLSLIFQIEREWQALDDRKFGIGNISVNGGLKYDKHQSHRKGVEMDIRPVRKDKMTGQEASCSRFDTKIYDREATIKLLRLFAQHPQVTKIYFNDDVVQQAIGAGRVRSWDGHNDHIHIEVKEFP